MPRKKRDQLTESAKSLRSVATRTRAHGPRHARQVRGDPMHKTRPADQQQLIVPALLGFVAGIDRRISLGQITGYLKAGAQSTAPGRHEDTTSQPESFSGQTGRCAGCAPSHRSSSRGRCGGLPLRPTGPHSVQTSSRARRASTRSSNAGISLICCRTTFRATSPNSRSGFSSITARGNRWIQCSKRCHWE